MHEDICYADATELARKIRQKELSPVEVLQAHLDRIDTINPKINAIPTMVNSAMEQAKAAEQAVIRGEALGPLHGVPFTIKDCVDTAGVRTTWGSLLLKENVPSSDATVVSRLKQAGGVFMAKTNMPEFAFWGETDNLIFGRTLNPWKLDRITGGSSGGEAAALVTGLSPLGIGSDVGGSIRGPAHHCGVVGLKATHGRVPLTGHWPATLLRAMHVGPMARTVRDVALEFSIIAGPDGVDSYALAVPPPEVPDIEQMPSGLRVGWNVGRGFGPVDPEVKETIERAATTLSEAGLQVEEVSLPALESMDITTISFNVYGPEGALYLEPIVSGREAELSPNIQRRLAEPAPTLREYLEALRDWDVLKQGMASYFSRYDLLLCPTFPLPAYPHGVDELTIAGETLPTRHVNKSALAWNLTGSPDVSVPFGWSSDGLPIGVQIVGRHLEEATVLSAAAALERMRGDSSRHPPV